MKEQNMSEVNLSSLQSQITYTEESSLSVTEPKSQRGRKKSAQSKVNKKERRLMQNRVSAFRFRIKRKQEYELLKDQVTALASENEALKQQVAQMRVIIESNIREMNKPAPQIPTGQNSYTAVLLHQLQKLQGEIGQYQQLTGFNRQQQQLLATSLINPTQTFVSNDSTTIHSNSSSPILKPTNDNNMNVNSSVPQHIYQQSRFPQNPLILVQNTQDLNQTMFNALQKSINPMFSGQQPQMGAHSLLNEALLKALSKQQ
ncbi:bzip transcription factor [Stylonychia lemnae]|uniref:Bzip transcription factor n=1 Tax=Stylonychia lemnae TaxID=5949 RepID=A0A077ZY13_STYLE|nr:bzip transcription factor [Stylonychia lemnae]|eukprot:CDW74122.1 bzip transcription factor [Stylonychia lemnae]